MPEKWDRRVDGLLPGKGLVSFSEPPGSRPPRKKQEQPLVSSARVKQVVRVMDVQHYVCMPLAKEAEKKIDLFL